MNNYHPHQSNEMIKQQQEIKKPCMMIMFFLILIFKKNDNVFIASLS